jgi:hypothetical protein
MKIKLIVSLLLICLVFSLGFAQAQQNEESSCKPIKFVNVTPDAFECMKKKLQDYGIDVPSGNKGELSRKGITGSFVWDGKSELTIIIKEKPLLVSCETADKRLILFVDECKGR